LVYGLNRGVDHGWLSASTLAVFAGSAILLAAFVWAEPRARAPLVPVAALRNRTMVAAGVGAFRSYGAFFPFICLDSSLTQHLLRYLPTGTGVDWLATSVTACVGAALVGSLLVSVVGVRRLLVAGMAVLALSALWLTRVPQGADFSADLLPALLLAGIAI